MYTILVISNSPKSSWEIVGILSRKDFEVIYEKNFEDGFQSLIRDKFDLFIAEENPFDNSFLFFVNKVLNQLKVPSIKGILLCSKTKNLIEAGPFKKILYAPFKPDELNDAIANVLNLKRRSSIRYLVRMHIGIGEEKNNFFKTCTTINLNKGGMLVEVTSALPLGKIFWWTFQVAGELDGLSIKGKIVNEVPIEGFSSKFRYGIKFLEECSESIKKIEEFLKQEF